MRSLLKRFLRLLRKAVSVVSSSSTKSWIPTRSLAVRAPSMSSWPCATSCSNNMAAECTKKSDISSVYFQKWICLKQICNTAAYSVLHGDSFTVFIILPILMRWAKFRAKVTFSCCAYTTLYQNFQSCVLTTAAGCLNVWINGSKREDNTKKVP